MRSLSGAAAVALMMAAASARAQEAPLPPVPPPPAPTAHTMRAAPPTAQNPGRRTGGEMVELHLTLGSFGAAATAGALLVAGSSPWLYVSLPFLGGGAGVLLGLAIDSGGGLPRGVPSAISTWAWTGFGAGMITRGAIDSSLQEPEVFALLVGSTVGGGLIGGMLGDATAPTPMDNHLVPSAALWGAWIALTSAHAVGMDGADVWRVTLGGYAAGVTAGTLAGLATDVAPAHLGLLWATVAGGTLIGVAVAAVAHEVARSESTGTPSEVASAGAAIGGAAGIGLGLLVIGTDGDGRGIAGGEATATLDVSAVPLRRGGLLVATHVW